METLNLALVGNHGRKRVDPSAGTEGRGLGIFSGKEEKLTKMPNEKKANSGPEREEEEKQKNKP